MEPKAKKHQVVDECDDPQSSVRRVQRRPRLDPRLDEIAEAARTGRITEQEAIEQLARVASEAVGHVLSPAERLGLESALRDLVNDPYVTALLHEKE